MVLSLAMPETSGRTEVYHPEFIITAGIRPIGVSADPRSDTTQLVLQVLVTPLDVLDPAHPGLTLGGQARRHQARTGPEVARVHGCPVEFFNTLDNRRTPFDADLRTHPLEFVDVLEARFVNPFTDDARPRRQGQ